VKCTLDILRGRQLGLQPVCKPKVLAASGSKSSGDSQLALVFDHGDSSDHTKQELSLRIIGVAGGDTPYQGVHNAVQTEVSDGARAISGAGSMGYCLG
jgi:hypothetical protein